MVFALKCWMTTASSVTLCDTDQEPTAIVQKLLRKKYKGYIYKKVNSPLFQFNKSKIYLNNFNLTIIHLSRSMT